MREQRVLERVVEASLGTEGFGEEVGLWDVALVPDQHSDGAPGIDDENFRLIGGMRELHFGLRFFLYSKKDENVSEHSEGGRKEE